MQNNAPWNQTLGVLSSGLLICLEVMQKHRPDNPYLPLPLLLPSLSWGEELVVVVLTLNSSWNVIHWDSSPYYWRGLISHWSLLLQPSDFGLTDHRSSLTVGLSTLYTMSLGLGTHLTVWDKALESLLSAFHTRPTQWVQRLEGWKRMRKKKNFEKKKHFEKKRFEKKQGWLDV